MKELKLLTSGFKICLPVVPQWMENKPEYITKKNVQLAYMTKKWGTKH
jgi:hypothetical protein